MIGAVQAVIHSERNTASDRYIRKIVEQSSRARIRRHCRSRERDQIGYLPAIQRQFHNALLFDDLADTDVARLDQSGVRLNLDLFADLSDFKRWIDDGIAIDLQHDSRLHERAKPG